MAMKQLLSIPLQLMLHVPALPPLTKAKGTGTLNLS